MTKEDMDEQPPLDAAEEGASTEEPMTEEPAAADDEGAACDPEAQAVTLEEKLLWPKQRRRQQNIWMVGSAPRHHLPISANAPP